MLSMSCVCNAFATVHCCLVVTCCVEQTSCLLFVMSNCEFVTFPYGILGQVRYLIVLIPDLCHRSYSAIRKGPTYRLCSTIDFTKYCEVKY